MQPIGEKYIDQLKKRGLLPAGPFSPSHTLAHAYWIHKPKATPGNTTPSLVHYFETGSETIPLDAPSLLLLPKEDKWVVWMQEGVPTMRPGDFRHCWDTEQEAIDDILDFYFGNPERMNAILVSNK